MKEHLTIIKVGGKIVENSESLNSLLKDFAAVEGKKLLVHGGGRSARRWLPGSVWKRRWSTDAASPTRLCSRWSLWSTADLSTNASWLDCKPLALTLWDSQG